MKGITAISLLVALSCSQAMAEGLVYDPYENYYAAYYGIGEAHEQEFSTTRTASSKTFEPRKDTHMADPNNYYNW